MPTVLFINGYKFFFYSSEGNEPAHVHIFKGDAEAKVWLEPEIKAVFFRDYSSREERDIMDLIKENHQQLKQKWYDYFNRKS